MGKLSKPLLRRSPLFPGESLLSFLERLSELNNYPPGMVLQLFRERLKYPSFNLTRQLTTKSLQMLADLTLVEPEKLYSASVDRFAKTIIPPDYHDHELIQLSSGEQIRTVKTSLRHHVGSDSDLLFCPFCLSETSYHRLC